MPSEHSEQPAARTIRRGFQAFPLSFLGAAVYAAFAVPVWVLEFLGHLPAWQQDAAGWHAHEMVFGYPLAVVAGYLITKASRALVLIAFGLWLAGRVAHFGPGLAAPLTATLDLVTLLVVPCSRCWQRAYRTTSATEPTYPSPVSLEWGNRNRRTKAPSAASIGFPPCPHLGPPAG